jgi:large conductance mechanosensitive channel
MWTEFKAFLIKDNVIGLAIAVILGTTLNRLVGSVVDDLIMPLVNVVTASTGGGAWEDIKVGLPGSAVNLATGELEGPALRIGFFLAALLNFFIIGFVLWRISKVFLKPKAA